MLKQSKHKQNKHKHRLVIIGDGFQHMLYKLAYQAWKFFKKYFLKNTFGAQVVVRYKGGFLLVKSSYRSTYSFPGGYINKKEYAVSAAVRELYEETGLTVKTIDLSFYKFFLVNMVVLFQVI